jgi:hypothetical protein
VKEKAAPLAARAQKLIGDNWQVSGAARLNARHEGQMNLGVSSGPKTAGLIVLADKGYQVSAHAMRSRTHPANTRTLSFKTWRVLRKLRCCPWRAGRSSGPSTYCRSAKPTQDENVQ